MPYIRVGIHIDAVDLDAEMQMRSGRNTGGSAQSELSSLLYVVAHAHEDLRHMQICSDKAVLVLNLNVVAGR